MAKHVLLSHHLGYCGSYDGRFYFPPYRICLCNSNALQLVYVSQTGILFDNMDYNRNDIRVTENQILHASSDALNSLHPS